MTINAFLVALFTVHFLLFTGAYLKSGKPRTLVTMGVFFLLILSTLLKIVSPEFTISDIAVFKVLRWMAWVLSATAVLILLKKLLFRVSD